MTRKEREDLKAMSLDVYGNANYYAKLMNKGEYKEINALTSDGGTVRVKRWFPITLEETKARMEKILSDRATAKELKAAEAIKNKEGGSDDSKQEEIKEAVAQPAQ